ncbi:hypothetical protein Tco_1416543, partial [Tanacetum coccineum]
DIKSGKFLVGFSSSLLNNREKKDGNECLIRRTEILLRHFFATSGKEVLGLVRSVSYCCRLEKGSLAASSISYVLASGRALKGKGRKERWSLLLRTWLVHSLAHELAASPEATKEGPRPGKGRVADQADTYDRRRKDPPFHSAWGTQVSSRIGEERWKKRLGINLGVFVRAVCGSLFKITAVPFRAAVGWTTAYRGLYWRDPTVNSCPKEKPFGSPRTFSISIISLAVKPTILPHILLAIVEPFAYPKGKGHYLQSVNRSRGRGGRLSYQMGDHLLMKLWRDIKQILLRNGCNSTKYMLGDRSDNRRDKQS